MKSSKLILGSLTCLFLLCIIGSFASSIDWSYFIDSPVKYLIDNAGAADVLFATFPFAPVNWPSGEPNMPGTQKDVYFIPLSGITSFPDIPANPTLPSQFHTLSGVIGLAPSCNVVRLYTTYRTTGFKADIEGETDGRYFKLSGEFFHPGDKAEIINFANACANSPGVLFIPMDDYYLVLGSPGHPVYLSPSFDTGKVGEGKKGTTFTAEAWSQRMVTKYVGDLPLTPSAP